MNADKSRVSLLMGPETFKLRYSGTLIDARIATPLRRFKNE